MQCRLSAYRHGWLKIKALDCPLVCIGNLTLGGTGKTPMTILVAERLNRMGRKVAIISRGYGRQCKAAGLVIVSDGQGRMASLEESGDEPYMMASRLPRIPVVVCADRWLAGKTAIERFGCDALVMDDGYQRLSLHRDLDILVFDGGKPLQDMRLFPVGRLREPLENMDRARACVVSRVNLSHDAGDRVLEIRKYQPTTPVLQADLKVSRLFSAGDRSHTVEVGSIRDQPALVVCALGNPDGFLQLISQELGARVVGKVLFRDHHRYTDKDTGAVKKAMADSGARIVLTTEKDAVKWQRFEEAFPWLVVAVEARLGEQDTELLDRLLSSL